MSRQEDVEGGNAMKPVRLILPGLLAVAVSYGLARYTYGLFVPDIRDELGLSTKVLGLIASGSYAGYLVASVVTAATAAVTGPRLPVVIGALSAAFGMSLIGLSSGPWSLAAGVIMAGTSPGFAYTPFSDAIVRLIPEHQQSRTYAIINSGTSFGVMIAGPVALWASSSWRSAWILFSVLAIVAAVWNGRLLPSGPHRLAGRRVEEGERTAAGEGQVARRGRTEPDDHGADTSVLLPSLRLRWLLGPKSARLFAVAFSVGLATSTYWTFSVDLISSSRDAQGGVSGPLFWSVLGIAGIVGGVAGDAVDKVGLKRALMLSVLSLACATGLLAVAPMSFPAIMVSAVVFGAGFIAVTGIVGVWSINVFYERPSAGFGAAFFLISAGQLVGPAAFGLLAEHTSLVTAFYAATITTLLCMLAGPRKDFRSAAPDPQ